MGGGGGEPRVEAHGVRAVMASASAGRGGESIGGEGAGCSTHSSLRQSETRVTSTESSGVRCCCGFVRYASSSVD